MTAINKSACKFVYFSEMKEYVYTAVYIRMLNIRALEFWSNTMLLHWFKSWKLGVVMLMSLKERCLRATINHTKYTRRKYFIKWRTVSIASHHYIQTMTCTFFHKWKVSSNNRRTINNWVTIVGCLFTYIFICL